MDETLKHTDTGGRHDINNDQVVPPTSSGASSEEYVDIPFPTSAGRTYSNIDSYASAQRRIDALLDLYRSQAPTCLEEELVRAEHLAVLEVLRRAVDGEAMEKEGKQGHPATHLALKSKGSVLQHVEKELHKINANCHTTGLETGNTAGDNASSRMRHSPPSSSVRYAISTPGRIVHSPLIYRDSAAREAYDKARMEGAAEYDKEHGLDTAWGRIQSWWNHVLG